MLQNLIKEINDDDNILLDFKYNFCNRAFIIQFVKLELEHFEYLKIISDMRIDVPYFERCGYGGISVPEPVIVEKYKGINFCRQGMQELEEKINKKIKYNNQRRKELYNEHFNRNEKQAIGCDEDKRNITKMIDACIEKNVEIEGINLIKFRELRNRMSWCNNDARNINRILFEECRV